MNDTQRLQKLEDNNLHVHAISDDEKLPIPLAYKIAGTHYIMKDNDIVFCGTLPDLKGWLLSYPTKEKVNDRN